MVCNCTHAELSCGLLSASYTFYVWVVYMGRDRKSDLSKTLNWISHLPINNKNLSGYTKKCRYIEANWTKNINGLPLWWYGKNYLNSKNPPRQKVGIVHFFPNKFIFIFYQTSRPLFSRFIFVLLFNPFSTTKKRRILFSLHSTTPGTFLSQLKITRYCTCLWCVYRPLLHCIHIKHIKLCTWWKMLKVLKGFFLHFEKKKCFYLFGHGNYYLKIKKANKIKRS